MNTSRSLALSSCIALKGQLIGIQVWEVQPPRVRIPSSGGSDDDPDKPCLDSGTFFGTFSYSHMTSLSLIVLQTR